MADAAGDDGEAQEGFRLPRNTYAFSFRTGRRSCRASCHLMSPCLVQRGGIKNRYNITPFPLGVYK